MKGIKDPVEAEYRLVSCSMNSGGAVYENCTMDGVVSAPGMTPTPVRHTSLLTPTAKWPQPGSVLPVTADRHDPTRLKIRWDDVPSNKQVAQQLAAEAARQAAAAQTAGTTGTEDTGGTGAGDWSAAAVADIVARAKAAGADVTVNTTTEVVGGGGRPVPAVAGGGLTPAESAQAAGGGAAALGLQPMSARVLAAHRVDVPAGMPDAPGGTWDLTLDLDALGGTGWTSVLRVSFSSPQRRALIADVGRTLPVLADPQRHDRIAIDVGRLG